jgi:transposase
MVATKPVGFRKGAEGLAALVRDTMGADPFSGAVYVFRATRLEDGKFCWPNIADGVVRLTAGQLQALMEGLDWRRVHDARETRVPVAAS